MLPAHDARKPPSCNRSTPSCTSHAPTREESRDIRHLGDRARLVPILKRTADDEIGNRASSVRQPLPHDRPLVSLRKFARQSQI